jgi:tetratricopeptide (TPR) repeat protein
MDFIRLGVALFTFVLPKIKNGKAARDFKKKWLKGNYPSKVSLMFKAGVADAKDFIDLPDELIKDLLEDEIIRNEIFRWIIEGVSFDNFSSNHLPLDAHYENYPRDKEKIVPFLQLILLKINEFKESTWDPEFQNILFGIDSLKGEIRTGFLRLEEQQLSQESRIHENMKAMFTDFLGSVGYEDLQQLLGEGKVLTARKKAEERLKHARSSEEKLELNAIIANSYLISGSGKEAIPFLFGALNVCEDHSRKNRLNAIIHLCNGELKEAIQFVEANIEKEGYTAKNLELLIQIQLNNHDYKSVLSLLDEHKFDDLKSTKVGIFLVLNRFDEAQTIVEEELEKTPDSKEWLLLKADAIVQKMEHSISNGIPVNPKKTYQEVEILLDSVETGNENSKQLFRIKELKAGLHFRNKQFRESAILFQELYEESIKDGSQFFKNAVWSYFLSDDYESAAKLLENKLINEKNTNDDEDALLLARVYLTAGKPHKALSTLESYVLFVSDSDVEFFIVKLEALFISLQLKEIERFIGDVEQNISTTIATILKGKLSSLKHEWDEAINSLEVALDNSAGKTPTQVKLLIIDAYINRGNDEDYQKVINIIPSILHWIHHEQMVQHYIFALYKLGKYAEILHHYHNTTIEPTVFTQEIVANIYSENKWFDKAKDIFESLYHQTQNLKFLLKISSCLFRLGKTLECFNTLQLAEKKIIENGSVQNFILLTNAYKSVGNYEKALEFAYKTFKMGEDEPNVWRFYFAQFTYLSSMIPDNENSEFVEAYHQTFNQFHQRFPEETPLFEQYRAIDDNGQLSEEFINKLKELTEGQSQMESLYKNHKISLEIYRKFIKKDPFQLWVHTSNHPKLYFWMNQTGGIEEIISGIKVAANSNQVFCDLFSLFTLNDLNLLDALRQSFQLYISQEQYEAIFIEYEELKFSRTKGINTLGYEDGRLIRDGATPGQVENTLNLLEELVNWIDTNCIKVGNAIFNPESFDDEDVLNSTENSLLICKDRNFNLLLDSHIIKDHAKNSFSVDTFSVVDYINSLYFSKEFDENLYYEAIGKLIMMGYRYISASSQVYQYYLRKNHHIITSEVELLFNYLREEEVHNEYAFSIVLDLLAWIWSEDFEFKIELTEFLCELILNKDQGKEMLRMIPEIVRDSEILVNDTMEKLEEIVIQISNKM